MLDMTILINLVFIYLPEKQSPLSRNVFGKKKSA